MAFKKSIALILLSLIAGSAFAMPVPVPVPATPPACKVTGACRR